jgi:U3 small nucleolar RNA-associated protein 3
MFKSKRSSLKLHPLTGRLVQYKELLDQMSHLDQIVMPQVEAILDGVKAGKSISAIVKKEQKRTLKASQG